MENNKDLISIKEYFELYFKKVESDIKAQAELNSQHFQLNQLAIDKASDRIDLRLEGMNEWRGQSKDREATFASKETLGLLEQRVKDLELSKALLEGKADQKSVETVKNISLVSIIIGVLGFILAVISLLIML